MNNILRLIIPLTVLSFIPIWSKAAIDSNNQTKVEKTGKKNGGDYCEYTLFDSEDVMAFVELLLSEEAGRGESEEELRLVQEKIEHDVNEIDAMSDQEIAKLTQPHDHLGPLEKRYQSMGTDELRTVLKTLALIDGIAEIIEDSQDGKEFEKSEKLTLLPPDFNKKLAQLYYQPGSALYELIELLLAHVFKSVDCIPDDKLHELADILASSKYFGTYLRSLNSNETKIALEAFIALNIAIGGLALLEVILSPLDLLDPN